jgi:hypothetical protein
MNTIRILEHTFSITPSASVEHHFREDLVILLTFIFEPAGVVSHLWRQSKAWRQVKLWLRSAGRLYAPFGLHSPLFVSLWCMCALLTAEKWRKVGLSRKMCVLAQHFWKSLLTVDCAGKIAGKLRAPCWRRVRGGSVGTGAVMPSMREWIWTRKRKGDEYLQRMWTLVSGFISQTICSGLICCDVTDQHSSHPLSLFLHKGSSCGAQQKQEEEGPRLMPPTFTGWGHVLRTNDRELSFV